LSVLSDEHVHRWQLRTHYDNCHYWESVYVCSCGATRSTGSERAITDDPYSSVFWMTDSECERCQDLLSGAEPKAWDEVHPG
jgi:hypothetical protein